MVTKPSKTIHYGRQSIVEQDIQAVVEVLKGDFLTQGPLIEKFEQQICAYTGARYCAVVSNGTAALHLAVKALKIEKQSKGITSPISFVASANCMAYSGLVPDFSDVDGATICMDPELLAQRMGNATRLVIPVHFAGQPCDMQRISEICREHDAYVVEDAAHAIGSRYEDGSMVGNCRYSDMTVFSFHPVKTITTGEGGAVTTNSKALYDRIKSLANHGITKEAGSFENDLFEPWHYEMKELGFNYRITDLQCALGISQLKRIEEFVSRRRAIAEVYSECLADLDMIEIPDQDSNGRSSRHIYVIQLKDFCRSDMYEKLKQKGIVTNVHYIPIHLQPYYMKRFGFLKGDFPIGEQYYETALTLPIFHSMTDAQVHYVVDSIKQII